MQRTVNRGFYSFKAKDTDTWIDAMWESHLPSVFWGLEVVTDPGPTQRISSRDTLHVVFCCCCTTVLCTCTDPSKGDLRRTGQRARAAGHGAHSNGLPQPCQLSSPAHAHTTYSPTLSHCQPTWLPLLGGGRWDHQSRVVWSLREQPSSSTTATFSSLQDHRQHCGCRLLLSATSHVPEACRYREDPSSTAMCYS